MINLDDQKKILVGLFIVLIMVLIYCRYDHNTQVSKSGFSQVNWQHDGMYTDVLNGEYDYADYIKPSVLEFYDRLDAPKPAGLNPVGSAN